MTRFDGDETCYVSNLFIENGKSGIRWVGGSEKKLAN